MSASMAGRLLISRPVLHDPNFDGTITLLLEHGPLGALGLIINQPSTLAVGDAFPSWEGIAPEPGVVFAGGPVERNALIVLGSSPSTPGPLPLGLHSVDLDDQDLFDTGVVDRIRVFAGYAGWGGGQLEGELSQGAWWTAECEIEDLFTSDPANLWAEVLRRNGGEMEWFAHFPDDASLN